MDHRAKLVTYSGQVQGVGFRYTVQRIATQYEMTGYVKNKSDGTVEMFIQGYPPDLDTCMDRIADHFSGYIRSTDVQDCPISNMYDSFLITY